MVFVGGLLFAFVMGHLFYRYDPKKADKDSFKFLVKMFERGLTQDQRKDPSYQDDYKNGNLGCAKEDDCEFPYPNYGNYLTQRGLIHLLPFILWKDATDKRRSKIYINLLKVRLRYYYPNKIGSIIRIESHIRLASSTWYVAGILRSISIFGILIAACALFSTRNLNQLTLSQSFAWHLPALLSPTIVLVFSWFARRTIRGFFHYQRLREVFFVLETTFTAFKGKYELLDPPFPDIKGQSKIPSNT
jgi:hypothetical protein